MVHPRWIRLAFAGALTALLAVVLASCGGGGSSSSSESEGGTTANASSETGGSATIAVKPRTIGVVNLGRQSPIESKLDNLLIAAGEHLGWNIEITDGAYSPEKMAAAAQSYINQGVDAMITTSLEASAIRPALVEAQAKHIPVIATNGGIKESDLFSAIYAEDEVKMGELAAESIVEQIPDPEVADMKVSVSLSGAQRDEGLKNVLPSSAIVSEQEVDLSSPVTNTQKAVSAALTANPNLNAIYLVYDNLNQPAVQTVERAHSDAKLFTYYATEENVERLESESNPVVSAVDVNLAKTGALAIEQLLAYFENGTEINKNALEEDPLDYRVLTKENVEKELGSDKEGFPVEEILAPFLAKWEKRY